ncbi:penicillin acylase family protein [Nocardioides sp.]|uniref:penicillin acylase family protein n=1 Tax=Nocardioides sp. TaxID=35761 RepID=UPI00273386C9|nr:penicillin acylase family protein [Nocardioides sp.]MDP3889669.1 penicillin acylase family protein [Nocardioides sp.]
MRLFRDAWGIPHVHGDSASDVAFGQGFATARDRAWQLEIIRLSVEGATASVLGAGGVEWDRFARRSLLGATSRRAFDALGAEDRGFVTAYAEGVGAALAAGVEAPELDELGVAAQPWEPWHPLGAFLLQHILFGTFPTKLWRRQVERFLGAEAVDLLRHEGDPAGSNAFALGGERTATGAPLVAGDPHRLFETPNVYQQAHLVCPEFDVVGLAFPGVPGVPHFGQAEGVAWAVTNAAADYQDVYVEQFARRDDEVLALGPDGWEAVRRHIETIVVRGGDDQQVEVLETDRGPVVIDEGPTVGLSLRTPSYALGDLGFAALLPQLRARTVADVEAALAHWVEPVNNVVLADSTGTVRHRVIGRVPLRPAEHRLRPVPAAGGHGWKGWVDLPHTDVAPVGAFVTANERASAAYDAIGDDFAAPFRHDRIASLLEPLDALSAAAAHQVLTDTSQQAGQALLAAIAALPPLDPAAEALRERLAAWDRRMDAESVDAAVFVGVRDQLVRRVCAVPALAPLRGPCAHGPLFAPWFNLEVRVQAALHSWFGPAAADALARLGIDLGPLLAEALVAVAADPLTRPWGEVHRFRPLHALADAGLPAPEPEVAGRGLPGDSDAVLAAGSVPGLETCSRGPVARYAWDLSDRSRSRWAVPLGASGVTGSPHAADQFDSWLSGALLPVVTDPAHLVEEST